MAQQNYTWPSVSVQATNPSVGTNGVAAPASSTEVGGIGADGNLHAISTDNSGNQNVNVVSSALPTGSATATNQVLEITQLTGIHSDTTAINGKTPALGQALAAASVPVVLTAAQLTTLTPLTSVTVTQATGSNLHTVVDSSALPTGAATESSLSFIVTSSQQAANNTASLNLNLGATTAGNTGPLVLGAVTTLPPSYSTGQVNALSLTTAGNLRVEAIASALPSGAATSALQTTGNTSLASIVTNTTGIATAANQATANTSLASVVTNQTNGTQKSQAATPTALTITNAGLTVGLTAVRLTVSGSAPSATRVVLVVTPDQASTAKFYIGSSSVTVGTGPQITSGQVFTANNDAGDYYIISDTAAQLVEIMEQA